MVTYDYLSDDAVTCDVDHDLFFKARVVVFLAPVYCIISQVQIHVVYAHLIMGINTCLAQET